MLKKLLVLFACVSIALAQNVEQEEFARDALFAHNLYRRVHGVSLLTLNPRLSQIAIQRANELANVGELNVRQNMFEGQNLGETVGSVGGFSSYNGNLNSSCFFFIF